MDPVAADIMGNVEESVKGEGENGPNDDELEIAEALLKGLQGISRIFSYFGTISPEYIFLRCSPSGWRVNGKGFDGHYLLKIKEFAAKIRER